jgi:hypothetical protein
MSIKTIISDLFGSKVTSQPEKINTITKTSTLVVQPTISKPLTLIKETINMSIFSTIIKDVTSFASKFEAELAKLWGKAPQISTVALTVLKFVSPLIETAISLEAGAGAGTAATDVLNEVERGLIAASGLITAVGPQPSVTTLINGISNDLTNLLAAGHVTNATSISNITLVIKELAALVGSLPVATPISTTSTTAVASTVTTL